ncbi:nucleotidyltransferase family protein [Puniceicoccus vermicola]|uniref:Nucleotidyltransferase domain-containing protein n=1 Tax=Puniceicoccus vermicola TaxID=388746 RepID=A0A7X1AYM7_9BACT|nr:nucleotidyltransferase domain-containing protein [Puniceicoccus vermicola]MBC2601245.1 nucleotidyltransferase domain-containing protein [Puniceicoccus vermicola]
MPDSAATSEQVRQLVATGKPRLEAWGVKRLSLFGSAARNEPEGRDYDFLVEFDSPPKLENFMGVKFYLEDLLGKPVDLYSRPACPDRFYQRIKHELLDVA